METTERAKLLVIRGPMCAGKTTLGESLRRKHMQASHLVPDALIQMVDHLASSEFRRQLVHDTILFMASQLLLQKRLVIVEVYGQDREFYDRLMDLAKRVQVGAMSVLLYPPLETCLARNRNPDRGARTNLSEDIISTHWRNTFRIEGELVFEMNPSDKEKEALLVQMERTIYAAL